MKALIITDDRPPHRAWQGASSPAVCAEVLGVGFFGVLDLGFRALV